VSQATKEILDIVSAVLGVVGGMVGALGTYFLLRWYQFFRGWDFLESVLETLLSLVKGGTRKAIDNITVQADFNPNKDDRAASLFGIHLIFIGFGLQVLGALVALAEAVFQWSQRVP
jgi:hypothetical protein